MMTTTREGHALYDALTDDRVFGCYDGQTDALYAFESSGAIIVYSMTGLDLAARARRTAREIIEHEPEAAEGLLNLADALEPAAEAAAEAAEDANLSSDDRLAITTAAAEAAAAWIREQGLDCSWEADRNAGWVRVSF